MLKIDEMLTLFLEHIKSFNKSIVVIYKKEKKGLFF